MSPPPLPGAGEPGPHPLHWGLVRGVGSPCPRWLSCCRPWPLGGPFRDQEREFSAGLHPEGWRWATSVLQLDPGPDDSIPESEDTLGILFPVSRVSAQPRCPLVWPSRRFRTEIMGQDQGEVHGGNQECRVPNKSRAAEPGLPPKPLGRPAPHGCSGAHGALGARSCLESAPALLGVGVGEVATALAPKSLESTKDPLPSLLPHPPGLPAVWLRSLRSARRLE